MAVWLLKPLNGVLKYNGISKCNQKRLSSQKMLEKARSFKVKSCCFFHWLWWENIPEGKSLAGVCVSSWNVGLIYLLRRRAAPETRQRRNRSAINFHEHHNKVVWSRLKEDYTGCGRTLLSGVCPQSLSVWQVQTLLFRCDTVYILPPLLLLQENCFFLPFFGHSICRYKTYRVYYFQWLRK